MVTSCRRTAVRVGVLLFSHRHIVKGMFLPGGAEELPSGPGMVRRCGAGVEGGARAGRGSGDTEKRG